MSNLGFFVKSKQFYEQAFLQNRRHGFISLVFPLDSIFSIFLRVDYVE